MAFPWARRPNAGRLDAVTLLHSQPRSGGDWARSVCFQVSSRKPNWQNFHSPFDITLPEGKANVKISLILQRDRFFFSAAPRVARRASAWAKIDKGPGVRHAGPSVFAKDATKSPGQALGKLVTRRLCCRPCRHRRWRGSALSAPRPGCRPSWRRTRWNRSRQQPAFLRQPAAA